MTSQIDVAFQKLACPQILLPVLKTRLPQSCYMYNQVIKYPVLKNDLVFYTIGDEICEDTWIVTCNIRADYGACYSISAPNNIVSGEKEIPNCIKSCFIGSSSKIDGDLAFNWQNGNISFLALEKPISKMIFDISANITQNVTEVHPCNLFYMEIEDALNLEITPPENVEVRRLDPKNKDDIDFILSTWKYKLAGSEIEIEKCLANNPSAGVFVENGGKCVSSVNITGAGIVSALYTDKEYRNRGYAKLTMKYCFKEFAKEGCIPCLTVEVKNERSNQFHSKGLAMKMVSVVDGILVKKLEVD